MVTKSLRGYLCFVLAIVMSAFLITVATVYAASPSDLVGTWGYGRIGHRNDGEWGTRAGMIAFNSDGTGTDNFEYNNNGSTGSSAQNFNYTFIPNLDGSFTVVYVYPDGTVKTHRYVISDEGNMLIMDGTYPGDRQRFRVAVRLDTNKTYTSADLTGDYYAISYGHNVNGIPCYYKGESGELTFDASGNFDVNYTMNCDDTVSSGSNNGTLTVAPYGTISDSDKLGYLTGDGKLAVVTNPVVADSWGEGVLMRRGDRTYSTADLAGTWALAGFGDDNGNMFVSVFGSMTCDSSGNCAYSLKNQWDGNIAYESGNWAGGSVAGDGSFGTYLGDLAPAYAGAIGNNGNTIILNVSFESGSLFHREIFVGLRCSNCSDLTALQTWFEEGDPAINYTGTWNPVTGCTSCSGGGLNSSSQTGATAEFSFSGDGFKWIGLKDSTMGKAKIYLDGVYLWKIDLYSRRSKVQTLFEMMGLTPGNHTFIIEVSGRKARRSTGYAVNIDAFEVVP